MTYFKREYESKHELIIGFVCAVGTDLRKFLTDINTHLESFSYKVNTIRLSNFLNVLGLAPRNYDSEFERVGTLMTLGDKAREKARRGDFLALMAVSEIKRTRSESVKSEQAHILLTLKHPEEVHLLRMIYGPGFWLIGVYSSEEQRRSDQKKFYSMTDEEFDKLNKRDYFEDDTDYGQQTSKTFHLADVFINVDGYDDLQRFFGLIFGDPFMTPTIDEQAMFFAHAAAIRSNSMSRQVGAAILNKNNDLMAVGCNEVPGLGGGPYYYELHKDDLRDHTWDRDPASIFRDRLINSVAEPYTGDQENLRKVLEGSEIKNLTEYGRAVHAEMEALMTCVRTGNNPIKGTLYTTLFPCHNCAKHIISAGIKRVVFIEPYTKSLAMDLFENYIILKDTPRDRCDLVEKKEEAQHQVCFEPFVGIGPRRYIDLFSMVTGTGIPLKRKDKKTGKPVKWDREKATSRLPMLPKSYLDREVTATIMVKELKDKFIKEDANGSTQ